MKNNKTNPFICGARRYATYFNALGERAIFSIAAAFLLLLVLSTSGCTGVTSAPKTTSSQQPSTASAATISVAPSSINFGSVPLGSTASQSVTISNGGTSNLTITQAAASAAGVTITGVTLPLVIDAGKQSTFNVIFAPKAAGTLAGQISIMSSISSTPSTVSLSGIGMASTAALAASVPSLNFGSVVVGKTSALTVNLTNVGNSNVTISKVTLSGTTYTVTGVSAGLILSPGQSATLDSTFLPLAAGSFSGSVTIASNATNSPSTISLSGSSTVQAVAHSATLSWTPTTSTVAGYNVYRSAVSGGPFTKLDSSVVAIDGYTDTSVQAGQTYYFVVTGVTAAGVESADSTQVSVTIPTP
jgi:Abnormal spindle-like microcephaly-assoc'd, ASPM-SPD-2-Hydin